MINTNALLLLWVKYNTLDIDEFFVAILQLPVNITAVYQFYGNRKEVRGYALGACETAVKTAFKLSDVIIIYYDNRYTTDR